MGFITVAKIAQILPVWNIGLRQKKKSGMDRIANGPQ